MYALSKDRLRLSKGDLRMTILEAMKKKRLFFEGGMGSMLQEAGLPDGLLPDLWSVMNQEAVRGVHRDYLLAGCDILATNTFGTNSQKLAPYGYTVEQVVFGAVEAARGAVSDTGRTDAYVALDLGPTGKLLKPYGDLDFEDAVALFAETVQAGAKAGADLILIETMSDLYELKAAVLAAKEACNLPIFASAIFDGQGKLLTGASPAAVTALLEGMGVDAFGVNCGLGPQQMGGVLKDLWNYASTPLLLQPNAGLPRNEGGKTVYDVSPREFAEQMVLLAPYATLLGGCCGTTPAHMKAMITACREVELPQITPKDTLLVTSYCQTVELGRGPVVIGERINPTGKKKLQAALREGDFDYVLREALSQEEAGAHILDVNVGLPGLDEPQALTNTMERIQSVTGLPLQLDTSDPAAMERALRRYNGKPLVNSVSGKDESLREILPLVKKYGGGLVCLTLDEEGIPETAAGRVAIAGKIVQMAAAYGIPRRELLVDGLTLPVSAGGDNAQVTLETLRRVKTELGVKTALGVSNVSFGLPKREQINTAFFTLALQAGLDGAIINPNSAAMMGAYHTYRALAGLDTGCETYIASFSGEAPAPQTSGPAEALQLRAAVEKGLRECIQRGPLAGYPVVGLSAVLYDGSYHPVDSSEMAFKTAAALAYKAGMPQANPVLLEPIGHLKATVPDANMGDVMGEVNKRRGRVLGMEPAGEGKQTVEADVPMAEMHDFTTFIRQVTQGRGSFTFEFERYEEAPQNVAQKVIEESKAENAE